VDFDVFTDVRCEPTDGSFREAIAAASSGGFDGFLAVGGGSAIDTAKAANLYATWPADFLESSTRRSAAGRRHRGRSSR
jgi:hydroxyacid-oxoacid transhydrogenase